MNRFFCFFALIFTLSSIAWAQDNRIEKTIRIFDNETEEALLTRHQEEPFLLLQSLNPGKSLESISWDKLVSKLHKRANKWKYKADEKLLEEIYFSAHQSILSRYEEHAYFSKTLQDGVYDCVTGSGLYALLLDEFGFEYQIIETEAHVYIKGMVGNTPFILESTFPVEGLIIGDEMVGAFEQKFITNANSFTLDPVYLGKITEESPSKGVYTVIGLRELAGLQYYNDAIKKFNEEDYAGTYTQLVKAEFLYPSERIIKLKQKISILLKPSLTAEKD